MRDADIKLQGQRSPHVYPVYIIQCTSGFSFFFILLLFGDRVDPSELELYFKSRKENASSFIIYLSFFFLI